MNSTRRNATSTRLRHFYVVIVFILIRFRPSLLLYTMGAFHSTKTFENLETPANGTEFPRKKNFFQKFRKLLHFRNTNHSTENFTDSWSKVEWKENFLEKPSKLSTFFKNFEKCYFIRHWKLPKIETRRFG